MNEGTIVKKDNAIPVAVLYQDGHACSLDEADTARAALYEQHPNAVSRQPVILSGDQCRRPRPLRDLLKGPFVTVLVAHDDGKRLEPMDERHLDRFMHILKNVHPSANTYEIAWRVQAGMDIRKREVCI